MAWLLLPDAAPGWAIMWAMAFALFYAGKLATLFDYLRSRNTQNRPPAKTGPNGCGALSTKVIAYLFGWPGMNAAAFLDGQSPSEVNRREWAIAIVETAAGVLLLGLAITFASTGPRGATELAIGWLGMVGFVVTLHFGVFRLLSCGWRGLGVDARPLMDEPLRSKRVSEFWSKRWNRAFRDLSHAYLFAPAARQFGPRLAIWVSFFVSGLLHELVITLPAGGGYGGPTAYFLLQAAAITFERSDRAKLFGLADGWKSRLLTGAVLLIPLPLLFPGVFVREVVLPWLSAMAAVLSQG